MQTWSGMTNQRIAITLERVADLLEQQGATAHRVRAWREGARTVRTHDREIYEVFRVDGRAGLEALPHIGARLANVIIELIRTERCATLERLQGDGARLLETLPGLGGCLAQRVQRELGVETLEELEVAAHDGRLAQVPGFGPRRIAAIREVLVARLHRSPAAPAPPRQPPVDILLDLDRDYRAAAAANRLPLIAPRHFNPNGIAWLPILHTEEGGWHLTAVFSNTALAHKLGRTHDWVVIYFYEAHGQEAHGLDGQATVVTEWRGALAGMRVVRGREAETAALDDRREHARRAS